MLVGMILIFVSVLQVCLGLPCSIRGHPDRRRAAGIASDTAGGRKSIVIQDVHGVRGRGRISIEASGRSYFAMGYLGWFVSPWVLVRNDGLVVSCSSPGAGSSPQKPWRAMGKVVAFSSEHMTSAT